MLQKFVIRHFVSFVTKSGKRTPSPNTQNWSQPLINRGHASKICTSWESGVGRAEEITLHTPICKILKSWNHSNHWIRSDRWRRFGSHWGFGHRENEGEGRSKPAKGEFAKEWGPSIGKDVWWAFNVSLTRYLRKSKGEVVRTIESWNHNWIMAVESWRIKGHWFGFLRIQTFRFQDSKEDSGGASKC